MKKAKIFLAVVLLAMELAGCGGSNGTSVSDNVDATVETVGGTHGGDREIPAKNEEQSNAAEKTTAPEESVVNKAESNLTIDNSSDPANMLANKAEIETSYHVTDMTAIMYAASTAEVRSGPDTNSSKLGTLSQNDEAAITGKVDNGWYKINYNGADGFVKEDLLSTEKIAVQEAPSTADSANSGSEANAGSSGNVASFGNEGSLGNIGSSDNKSSSEVTAPSVGDTVENLVWIPTKTGKKYHSNPSCSNMNNPGQVTLEQAIALKYTPCKKCYN